LNYRPWKVDEAILLQFQEVLEENILFHFTNFHLTYAFSLDSKFLYVTPILAVKNKILGWLQETSVLFCVTCCVWKLFLAISIAKMMQWTWNLEWSFLKHERYYLNFFKFFKNDKVGGTKFWTYVTLVVLLVSSTIEYLFWKVRSWNFVGCFLVWKYSFPREGVLIAYCKWVLHWPKVSNICNGFLNNGKWFWWFFLWTDIPIKLLQMDKFPFLFKIFFPTFY